ncbi:helix-turn-helix domain-containing GNAT family N-acetyltransferase [Tardiphaga sp.]|uniref:bifunctional helix-turn-helix transcriptional regulator/GNAT family N-acetyltransferase n=1 Tax=Tardiphaga sp. TaxID=1926292 RepID=UPI00260312B5|nr:helix-turn-helix domain-containing GNAT family N-acetyltransferase [Tardiphaga sp.]MDB5617615.1 MarR family transcriptional regulator [Tardiphaga sp.]
MPPAISSPAISDQQIAAVRDFNRFYTRRLGVLEQQFLDSPWSLTEARVLYELASREASSAKEIAAALDIDAGYLSRIIQNFSEKGLLTRRPLPADRRQYQLGLTAKGRLAYGRVNRSSHDDIAAMLSELTPADAARVAQSMTTIERLLGNETAPPQATLRGPQPGDMGWVVQSHGALYAAEYGFDPVFEGVVADIVAKFVASFDASRERCWIADIAGQPVGSVFLVGQSDEIAKLRLLLIDPAGRGQGLGQRLVRECIGFARQCGYRQITLGTHSILIAARKIYQDAGFVRIASAPHRGFGVDLTEETWELRL